MSVQSKQQGLNQTIFKNYEHTNFEQLIIVNIQRSRISIPSNIKTIRPCYNICLGDHALIRKRIFLMRFDF